MRYFFISCIFIIITIGGFFCKETPPEPPPPPHLKTVYLAAKDTGVTDAILHVSIFNTEKPSRFVLRRDGKTILTSQYPTLDTLIVSDSLLPNRTYTYKAYRLTDSIAVDSSAAVTITTMDTTSHNFIWQLDTLGDGASSTLYDVAIVNDTCVWTVGEINKRDSLGNWENEPYGLAIWNGHSWQLRKLYYVGAGGRNVLSNIRGIYYFNSSEIWFAAGSIFRWDGISNEAQLMLSRLTFPDPLASIEKLWGTSSSDLYGVGNVGTIAHFDGTSWQKLESGTTLDIQDIYGSRNARTGTLEILVIASNPFSSNDRKILKISGNTVSAIPDSAIQVYLSSVWLSSGRKYYVTGSGIYEKRVLSERRWKNGELDFTPYYTFAIRGNDINDVVAAGSSGEVLHYNGITWQSYRSSTQMTMGSYLRVAMNGNLIVAVGENYNRAAVALGRRR